MIRFVGLFYLVESLLSFTGVNAMHGRESSGHEAVKGIMILGKSHIGRIDDDFVCATLDWWRPQKCDYGTCRWGHASLLNLHKSESEEFTPFNFHFLRDLNNKILLNAVKDKVIYGTEESAKPCTPFMDELNSFFQNAGANVIFGLNALAGRTIQSGSAIGPWNFNAESFIRYTVRKNYSIAGWEFGNELCGSGVGTSVSANQYASDIAALRNIIHDVYRGIRHMPLVISPGGFYDANWFQEFVNKSGKSVDVVSHHTYNLGPVASKTYFKNQQPKQKHGLVRQEGLTTVATILCLMHLSTASGIWIQLGMSAVYDTRTYCRQSLVGGNYGLLNTTTFVPNPDYYSVTDKRFGIGEVPWSNCRTRLFGRGALEQRLSCLRVNPRSRVKAVKTATDLIIRLGCEHHILWCDSFPNPTLTRDAYPLDCALSHLGFRTLKSTINANNCIGT
ncbi:Heparanase-like protein [Arachis hypogaea]|nr:Heparanase-like protein [Arachis hypogaea]